MTRDQLKSIAMGSLITIGLGCIVLGWLIDEWEFFAFGLTAFATAWVLEDDKGEVK